jgi:hypothetical protein
MARYAGGSPVGSCAGGTYGDDAMDAMDAMEDMERECEWE